MVPNYFWHQNHTLFLWKTMSQWHQPACLDLDLFKSFSPLPALSERKKHWTVGLWWKSSKKKKINPSYIIPTTTAKLAMRAWRCCLIMLNTFILHPKSCIVDNCLYMSISLIAYLLPPCPFLLLASLLGGVTFLYWIYMPSFNGFFIIVHSKWKSTIH